MRKRERRHDVIRDIVRENAVRTQKELAEHLKAAGFECTQATISRDVMDMGLVKSADGCYVLPEELRLARMVDDLVSDVLPACNLVVVKTSAGAAQGVSAALDGAALRGALGTVAGDDTILVACESDEAASHVAAQIDKLRKH